MMLVFTWAPACASNRRCPRTVAEKQTGLSRGQCFPPAKFLTICHLVIEITWARAPLAIPPHGFLALAKLSKVTLEPACSLTSLLGFGQKNCGCFMLLWHLAAVIAPSTVTSKLPSSTPAGRPSNLQPIVKFEEKCQDLQYITCPAAQEARRRPVCVCVW